MLNQTGVKVREIGNVTQILEDDKIWIAFSCQISDEGVTAGEDGRKIVRAGHPLSGELTDRSTPFKVATTDAAGVLVNDVDVTDGPANGSVCVFGSVNLDRMDETAAAALQAAKPPLIIILR